MGYLISRYVVTSYTYIQKKVNILVFCNNILLNVLNSHQNQTDQYILLLVKNLLLLNLV